MRDKSVSLAKGIAIALVVMAHSICIDFIVRCIGIYVLSLFFFMSGYCFKDKYLDDALAFIKAFYGNILALPEMVASVPAFT
jgi:fucose 4-O-acetylase-like acetyltransferase